MIKMILNISVIITLIGSLACNNISSIEKEDVINFLNINTKCLLLNSKIGLWRFFELIVFKGVIYDKNK